MNKKNVFSTFTFLPICLGLLLCVAHLSSCQNEPKSTSSDDSPVQTVKETASSPNHTNNSTPEKSISTTPDVAIDYGQALQTIVAKDSKGVIRGVDFTMNKQAVKTKEKKANFVNEQQDGSLLYDIDLNENEFVDLNYIFNENQELTSIKTDIYSKSNAAARQMYQTFEKHFNDTYETVNKTTWKGKGLTAHLRLLSSSKDNGVIVEWRKK